MSADSTSIAPSVFERRQLMEIARDRFRAAGRRRFRGTLIDNCALAPMGKGHGNDGKPFDIETACYLKPVVEAYHLPTTRKVVIMAGVKTVKSFFLEMAAAYHLCHSVGDVMIYFGTGEVADDVSTTRILDYFAGIPSYQEKMAAIVSRFDATMGAIKFPDKTLFIKPANLANTQQKNLGFMGIQDAFVTERSGMIDQGIERTTQYATEKKIVIESQGGEKGFDFDRHYEDTDQRELHVDCPCCGKSHIFNWKVYDEQSMTRPDDFVATLPNAECGVRPSSEALRRVESADPKKSVREKLTAELLKPERRVAGFKRGADELIKLPDGDYNQAAVLRETFFECFHCGGHWRDDGEFGATRIALDRSSHYIAANPKALASNVGFNFPQWINRRIPWGNIMLEKLKRQRIASELGNYEPIKQWWQKFAARTWDKDIGARSPEKIGATIYEIDPKVKHPGEVCRITGIDFQFNGTHMPYQAWAIGDGHRPRLLHCEWIKAPSGFTDHLAREFCKLRARELNKQWGIEPQNCMIDAAHRPDLVREWAAEDAVFAKIRAGNRIIQKWVSYGLLMGDDRVSYKWAHPGRKATLERFKQYEWVNVDIVKDGRRMRIPIHHRLWSNFSIKEIAERWRDGDGAPKIEVHPNFLKDAGKEGFDAQMKSERQMPWKGRPGKLRYDNEGRPNHFWDGFCMVMVRMDELGFLNSFGPPPEADDEK